MFKTKFEWNPGTYPIETDELNNKKHTYRGMGIEQTPRGFEISVGRGMMLPGIYTNLFLAARAVDKEIGKRVDMKAKRKPRKKRDGT
jgi:hypothetical protein